MASGVPPSPRPMPSKGPGELELGRFWELLDPETQPAMPVPDCAYSESIFEDHKEVSGVRES